MSLDTLVKELELIDRAYKTNRDHDTALASYRRLSRTNPLLRTLLADILHSLIPARWRRK
jgi:hypothetical protein